MSGEIVPFGKYKGDTAEKLAFDRQYAEWLMQQPWFKEKYPTIYNVVVHYGAEPTETPEHNAMQARFLDDAYCLALLTFVDHEWLAKLRQTIERYRTIDKVPASVRCEERLTVRATFEVKGWDVVVGVCVEVTPRWRTFAEHREPGWVRCWEDNTEHYNRRFSEEEVIGPYCTWKDRSMAVDADTAMYIECKPTLGDDYPAVLRQVQRYMGDDHRGHAIVLVGSYTGQAVPWTSVQAIFAKSSIKLVLAGFEHPEPHPF